VQAIESALNAMIMPHHVPVCPFSQRLEILVALEGLAVEPSWRDRPMPPRDEHGPGGTDADLGLLAVQASHCGGEPTSPE